MRKSGIQRRSWMKRGTKELQRWTRIKPLNAENQAKRAARYKGYMSSPAWRARRREALASAGNRCEMLLLSRERCPATKHLTVHHKTYARFGAELPTDLAVLCKAHHDAHHAAQPIKPRAVRRAS